MRCEEDGSELFATYTLFLSNEDMLPECTLHSPLDNRHRSLSRAELACHEVIVTDIKRFQRVHCAMSYLSTASSCAI